jgi:hypothetical protein
MTVPWVVWSEDNGSGTHAIYIARLLGGHRFALFNKGIALSNLASDATSPDITFSHNEPYVSWHQMVNGTDRLFLGHFDNGTGHQIFHLDTPTGVTGSATGLAPGVRAPVSSTCQATRSNGDGSSCSGGSVGTPFTAFTTGTSPQRVLSDAYSPTGLQSRAVTAIKPTSAILHGVVNPGGATVVAGFQYSKTLTYTKFGLTHLDAADSTQKFSIPIKGLSPATTMHYRPFFLTDVKLMFGPSHTFRTARPASHLSIGRSARIRAGHLVTIRTVLRDTFHHRVIPRVRVTLWRRLTAAGSHWHRVATRKTGPHGGAARALRPKSSTKYQWRFAGGPNHAPTRSRVQTIRVS